MPCAAHRQQEHERQLTLPLPDIDTVPGNLPVPPKQVHEKRRYHLRSPRLPEYVMVPIPLEPLVLVGSRLIPKRLFEELYELHY